MILKNIKFYKININMEEVGIDCVSFILIIIYIT